MRGIGTNRVSLEMCEYCQRFELLDMVNDAILLIDTENHNIVFMNQKALSMYGYRKLDIDHLSVVDLTNGSLETLNKNLARVIEQAKRGWFFTANHIKSDGTVFKVEISARFLAVHGQKVIVALVRDMTAETKMRQEVEIAGKVQRLLLPEAVDHELFCMRTVYQPLYGLSGDLYDVQYDEDSQTLFGIILDVMGHGIAATSQGGILRYLFRQTVEKHIAVGDKLAWINNEVMPFFSCGGFAAALLFAFDFANRTLTYSAAGISHFIWLNSNGARVIKSPGLFLGINENEAYDEQIISFQPGDGFFFLTDGLFEMLSQPIEHTHTFWTMYELCKNLPVNKAIKDDASGMGIFIR